MPIRTAEALSELIAQIRPADPGIYEASRCHWDSIAKPLGSLGVLEEDLSRIAALTCNVIPSLQRRRLLVICADNGVIVHGVSQSGSEVTHAVAAALGASCSTVSFMARTAGCDVVPVDVGMVSDTPAGVRCMKLQRGTGDISIGPAMSEEVCLRAIFCGIDLAREQAEEGIDLLLLGEMGIGNTTTSTALACVLLGQSPDSLAGRGAGLSDQGLQRKREIIRRAILQNAPDPLSPMDVLCKVGGLDLAVLCGICLGAARYRIPVLLDGVITNAAALCAVRLCPAAADALIASHCSAEPAAEMLLNALGLRPCVSAGLHLGEGSGAVLCLPLLDQALAVYNSRHSFDVLGIEAYRHLEGHNAC